MNYYSNVTDVNQIVQHIKGLGFDASLLEDDAEGHSVVELQVKNHSIFLKNSLPVTHLKQID